jgi:hypothetical protein
MKRQLFLTLALLSFACAGVQTAAAQFPKSIKIPKLGTPKPTPSPDSDSGSQPAQPESQPRPATPTSGSGAPRAGGPYARRILPTETPLFLPDTLEVRSSLQDGKWYPITTFRAFYEGEIRLRYKIDYTLPNGSPWYSETMEQKGGYLMESTYDNERGAKAVPTDGLFGIKITNMRDNSVVFQGKFRVTKFKQDGASGPKDVDYSIDHDWALPIGYADVDWGTSDPNPDQGNPVVRMWFKGNIKTDDLEARLFYNGNQIATTDEGGRIGSYERRFSQYAGNNPALLWQQLEFGWPRRVLFIAQEQARNYTANNGKTYINQMPGEYTVKVYYQGEQIRETKFRIADGDLAGVGVSLPNGLRTNKILLPVKVMGTVEKWIPARYPAEAFYGNAPTVNPQ